MEGRKLEFVYLKLKEGIENLKCFGDLALGKHAVGMQCG
tara:strand:- start:744 stop:860 length:117 start_codon:yes stop_codon:yes gene_type:complete